MKIFSIGIIVLTLLIGVAGCKSIPMLEQLVSKPTLSVANFTMSEANFLKQTFKVKLKVDNPNAFSLPILGLDYGLNIAGVDVARGSNDKSLTVPAGGSEYLKLDFNTNLLKTLPDLKRVILSGGKNMSYTIAGNLKTKNAMVNSIPFKKTGQFEFAFR